MIHSNGHLIYVAHKFQNDKENIERVSKLVVWLNDNYPKCLFYAPWVPLAADAFDRLMSEPKRPRRFLEQDMRTDLAFIRISNGLFIFNAIGSVGCQKERKEAEESLGFQYICDLGFLESIDQITHYHKQTLERFYG